MTPLRRAAAERRAALQLQARDASATLLLRGRALVLHPVVDPGVAEGHQRAVGCCRLRNLTRVVPVALGSVGRRYRNSETKLHVQTAHYRSLDTQVVLRVLSVRREIAAGKNYPLPADAAANG